MLSATYIRPHNDIHCRKIASNHENASSYGRVGQCFKGLALPHSSVCNMMVPQLVLVLAVIGGATALLRPINLTLCEKASENVSRFLTDLYLVQPQQHDSCELANTSTPVVSHHPSSMRTTL